MADELKDILMESLETIDPFLLTSWEKQTQTVTDESEAQLANTNVAVRVAVSSSARNGVVGMGGAIKIQTSIQSDPGIGTFTCTLGMRDEQNPYSDKLSAMAKALSTLSRVKYRKIVVLTRNKAAVLMLKQPQQQSGQEQTRHIYRFIRELKRDGNTITILWLPSNEESKLLKLAKAKAKEATRQGAFPQTQIPFMRLTTLDVARSKQNTLSLPDKIGKHFKKIDAVLPGKHTRQLYNQLSWKEASVLAQLRTGVGRVNAYLYRIKAAPSDQCVCKQARETVKHFLFQCRK